MATNRRCARIQKDPAMHFLPLLCQWFGCNRLSLLLRPRAHKFHGIESSQLPAQLPWTGTGYKGHSEWNARATIVTVSSGNFTPYISSFTETSDNAGCRWLCYLNKQHTFILCFMQMSGKNVKTQLSWDRIYWFDDDYMFRPCLAIFRS